VSNWTGSWFCICFCLLLLRSANAPAGYLGAGKVRPPLHCCVICKRIPPCQLFCIAAESFRYHRHFASIQCDRAVRLSLFLGRTREVKGILVRKLSLKASPHTKSQYCTVTLYASTVPVTPHDLRTCGRQHTHCGRSGTRLRPC
jgi:hypothetical protein